MRRILIDRAGPAPVRSRPWPPHRLRRGSVGRNAVIAGAALLLLQACTVSRPRSKDLDEATESLPALTAKGIVGPVRGTPKEEIQRLDSLPPEPTVRLRRSWVQLSTGDSRRALRELNRTLFGDPPPTTEVAAWAHYLRALAYAKDGDDDHSRYDLAEAAKLSRDAELSQLIAAVDRPSEAAARALPHGIAQHLGRADWGASAPRTSGMVPMTHIDRITLHHSAMFAERESLDRTGAIVRAIQKNHMRGRGWADIGYHYIIDRQGRVWDGRPVQWQGAHAGNPTSNRGNIGICLLGNFVRSGDGQQPSAEQLAAMNELVNELCEHYRIPPSRVLTHREIRATACPGAFLQAAVENLRSSMLSRAGDGLAGRASRVSDS